MHSGSKGNARSVSMMTISESDNWEICCSSGMKYGQFVDWEKIDPEAARKYEQILKSEHRQLKSMGRDGFWAMPHTLRAKGYYHIIHNIDSRLRPLKFFIKTHVATLSDCGRSSVAEPSHQTETCFMIWSRSFLESRNSAATQSQSTWRMEKFQGTFLARNLFFMK